MDVRFLIEYKKEIVQLPVNPEGFKIPYRGNNKTEEIVKLGEVSIFKQRKLSEFSIESFFPQSGNRSYIVTGGSFKGPKFYIDFFKKIMNDTDKQPCLIAVHGLNFSVTASLEDFEYSYEAGDEDAHYTLKFKEYRAPVVRTVVINNTPQARGIVQTSTSRPKTSIAIGDTVTVNGKYWYSSYGDKPFGTFTNFTGKVSHIVANKNRKYRYHITTPSGGYRGWVDESQISNIR